MNLRRSYRPTSGYLGVVSPPDFGFRRLEFGILQIASGQAYSARSGTHETGLVVLTGRCNVRGEGFFYEDLGGRDSVFDGCASAAYVPKAVDYAITAVTDRVEIAVCRAPAQAVGRPQVIRPSDVIVEARGDGHFERSVHDIIGPQVEAESILIGETFTPAGHWSGYPPHKHDEDVAERESALEEIYFYRVRPENGFGVQVVYSSPDARPPLEEAWLIRSNDVGVIPYGYHPVSAAPGYDLYYLWFLTGGVRRLLVRDDPRHSWLAGPAPAPRG